MTVSPYDGLNLPADFDPDSFDDGLGEFNADQIVTPRVTILHKEGLFKDSLSNETFDSIDAIVLGVVMQRVLWDTNMEEGDVPMCKSPNHVHGYPNIDEEISKSKRFPWGKTPFPPQGIQDTDGVATLPVLSCKACPLKDWKSHPDGRRPWCNEQWTLPIMYRPTGAPEEVQYTPAILTIQKTSITPLKGYLSGFRQKNVPAFSAITRITLQGEVKGTTEYSKAVFARVGEIPQSDWMYYSGRFKEIRDFLHRAPVLRDSEGEVLAISPYEIEQRQEQGQEAPAAVGASPAPAAAPQQQTAPAAQPEAPAPAPAAEPAAPAPAPAAAPQAAPAPAASAAPAAAPSPAPAAAAPAAPAPAPAAPPVAQAPAPAAPAPAAPAPAQPTAQAAGGEDIVEAEIVPDEELPF